MTNDMSLAVLRGFSSKIKVALLLGWMTSSVVGMYCGKKDCYDVLGVGQRSTSQEIKKSYRKLSLQYHPDKNPSPEADKMFKEIANAYEIISNPEMRAEYDYALEHPEQVR